MLLPHGFLLKLQTDVRCDAMRIPSHNVHVAMATTGLCLVGNRYELLLSFQRDCSKECRYHVLVMSPCQKEETYFPSNFPNLLYNPCFPQAHKKNGKLVILKDRYS